MIFRKVPHPANFSFAHSFDPETATFTIDGDLFRAEIQTYSGGLTRIRIENRRWKPYKPLHPLNPPSKTVKPPKAGADLALRIAKTLSGVPGEAFGVMGQAWLFQFQVEEGARFYGMGEKNFDRIEHSARRTKFWNTDVWADFHEKEWQESTPDPSYLSVPYLIVKSGGQYFGILAHTPYPVFMETPGEQEVFVDWQRTSPHVIVGAEGGPPDLWVIEGPTLPELTRKLQNLVGVTPLPPVWALGYHQSRWGYATQHQLYELDDKFRHYRIPLDGLWLDIEYMDGYRIFTIDANNFPDGVESAVWRVWRHRRRVVPILDPGIKAEPGYAIYDEGKKKGMFCVNPQGNEFIGMVWPGQTVYPDFTQGKVRRWWAGHVRDLTKKGFAGYWVDMNDPATGSVDPRGMLFQNGRAPHEAHRNEYALGMQMATRDGIRRARPRSRPFVLSRSGFIGTGAYSAVWSGDNCATYHHLRLAIPTALNLGLSGIPFNGCDVGGFGGDTPEALMLDWMKACFLFPFFRNHTMHGARPQEPWAYSRRGLGMIRHLIQLRYRFMPYLYNLFVEQERTGEAILRPLFYDYEAPELETISDQFLVGPWVLQAPCVEEGAKSRSLLLPGDAPWYRLADGKWLAPGRYEENLTRDSTPVFVRAGAIVPLTAQLPTKAKTKLDEVEFHIFAPEGWSGTTETTYVADDGESMAYLKGQRSELRVRVTGDGKRLDIETETLADRHGPIEASFVLHTPISTVRLNGKSVKTTPDETHFFGPLRVTRIA